MNELTPQQVAEFLQQHPDFLVQRPALLAELELQQQAKGATSLVHIQQRQLREHNTALKNKIEQLTQHAAQNELIYRLFSQCHKQLSTHSDFNALASSLSQVICSNSGIDECQLVKYSTKFDKLINHRLSNSSYYLGRMNSDEHALFFQPTTRSCAVFLIGEKTKPVAFLALGSHNENHFDPAQDTLFAMDFVHSLALRLQALA
ncbi:DUF484 family protein [Pseudoalteromonas sp. MMG010]|uniref:DUF484 family protein n=1 Tax=Pseudoalteromonas sp. MMG010 TaxID=2822685 RepID=UPI001B3A44DF|nr:DUF484 family protein [Pseudoalteromonas sp. MMG010]MBQ4834097.1 DUF484 family protein [Pseudoalteromonas sp. MMG010]